MAGVVDEVFVRVGRVLLVHAGGRVIGTTAEHRVWAAGRGWVAAADLRPGDKLVGPDGLTTAVDAVEDTGRVERVYNLRVAGHATYFVGSPDWGWAAWAHNTYYQVGLEPFQTGDPTSPTDTALKQLLRASPDRLQGARLAASINLNDVGWADNKYYNIYMIVYLLINRNAGPS